MKGVYGEENPAKSRKYNLPVTFTMLQNRIFLKESNKIPRPKTPLSSVENSAEFG